MIIFPPYLLSPHLLFPTLSFPPNLCHYFSKEKHVHTHAHWYTHTHTKIRKRSNNGHNKDSNLYFLTASAWIGGLLWSVENIHNITSFKITDFHSNSYQFQIASWLTLDFVLTSILPVKILSILSLVRSVHAVTVSLCSYVHPSYGAWKALCLGVIYVSGSSNILLIHGPLNCEVKGVMKIFTIQMSVPKSLTL